MDAFSKLKRFFYLGNLSPVYVKRQEDNLMDQFDTLKELVCDNGIDAERLITLIKNHTQRQEILLPRVNEVWFSYAVYLSEIIVEKERTKAYKAFPDIVRTDRDMFTFAHYSWQIQKRKGCKGFSQTVRKAINLWYKKLTELEIIDMMARNRSLHGFSHKDVIVMCHVNMAKVGKKDLYNAMFKPASKALVENIALVPQEPDSVVKLNAVLQLKCCTDFLIAKELIEKEKLKFENVPTSLYREVAVWQALLPSFTYRELLEHVFMLLDLKLFGNGALQLAYVEALGSEKLLVEDVVTPILMLACSKRLQTRKRYSEKIKQTFHAQKIEQTHHPQYPSIRNEITKMFKLSFNHCLPMTGLKFFIAINMQESYNKKPVICQTQVNCTEAAITMAYTYFRSENKVDVYTFTPNSTTLQQIDWKKDSTYDEAVELCKANQHPKTMQRLCIPIREASKKIDSYDVFLIIVPSGARGNPFFKPDMLIKHLTEYRNGKKNERTRIIIVNLHRYSSSMVHGKKIEDNGILEICGFSETTVKLINAYATHLFS